MPPKMSSDDRKPGVARARMTVRVPVAVPARVVMRVRTDVWSAAAWGLDFFAFVRNDP